MVDVFLANPPSQNIQAGNPIMPPASPPHNTQSVPQRLSPKLFTAFCRNPDISFASQNENEQIFLFLRRHFVTNIPWLATTLILLILPLIIFFTLRITNPFALVLPNGIPARYELVYFLFYYLVVFSIALVYFLSWFFSISLITSEQV